MTHEDILIGTSRLRSNRARRQMSWIKTGTRSSRDAASGNCMPEIFAVARLSDKGSKTVSGSVGLQTMETLHTGSTPGSTATASTTGPGPQDQSQDQKLGSIWRCSRDHSGSCLKDQLEMYRGHFVKDQFGSKDQTMIKQRGERCEDQ